MRAHACGARALTHADSAGSTLEILISVGVKSCEVFDSVNKRESRSEEAGPRLMMMTMMMMMMMMMMMSIIVVNLLEY